MFSTKFKKIYYNFAKNIILENSKMADMLWNNLENQGRGVTLTFPGCIC